VVCPRPAGEDRVKWNRRTRPGSTIDIKSKTALVTTFGIFPVALSLGALGGLRQPLAIEPSIRWA
jgi:hypothetical protein